MNQALLLHLRALNRQILNPGTIKHRRFDGHIATAKNCGTHWIKYMLSLALAEIYDVPPPEHIADDSIVGHTKNPPIYQSIPQIAVTHSHPHYLMRWPLMHRMLHLPRFVVIVRDIRDILYSIFKKVEGPVLDKKKGQFGVDFSTYLEGDVTGKTRIEDIWGLILFFNAWGAIKKACPENVHIIHYENMIAAPDVHLKNLLDLFEVRAGESVLQKAIEGARKEKMQEKAAVHKTQYDRIVNLTHTGPEKLYTHEKLCLIEDLCSRYLKHDFGYDYSADFYIRNRPERVAL